MRIKLGSSIEVTPSNRQEKDIILQILDRELKYANPEFLKAKGRAKEKLPEHISNFREIGNKFILPKGTHRVLRSIMKAGVKLENTIFDKAAGRKIDFKHKYEPRDEEQVKAIDSYLNKKSKHALLIGSCGFGKTYCALKIVEKVGVNTIIIVDENLILEQWYEALEDDCIIDMDKVGIIGDGKENFKGKDIVIASKDTLINRPDTLKALSEEFGMVIVDEAHTCAADVFQEVLSVLKPEYLLGLTATPDRSDGASYLMYDGIGDICFKADFEYLIQQGSVMKPFLKGIFVKKTTSYEEEFKVWNKEEVERMKAIKPGKDGKFKWKSKPYTPQGWKRKITMQGKAQMDWQFLTTKGVEKDMGTIGAISKLIKFHYDNGDQLICICQKVEFSKKYVKALEELGVPPEEIGLLLGNTKKKERKRVIAEAKERKIKIIITSKLMDKAISVNPSNILFNLYPSKNNSSLTQRLGRISRTCEGKTYALAYDVIYDHGILFNQFFNPKKECRLGVYKEVTKLMPQVEGELIPNLVPYFWNRGVPNFNYDYFNKFKFDFDKPIQGQLKSKFYIEV